jgi:hypothetical protein
VPDFFAALFVLLAFLALVQKRFGIAGVWLGVGLLFRTHVLALLVAVVVVLVISDRRAILKIIAGALPFVLLQGLIQVWSGHGFFESAQALNVFRMMYGMDWSEPPQLHQGMFALIASDPSRFINAYLSNLINSSYLIIPLVIVLFWRKTEKLRLLAIVSLIYILVITIGFSPRALVPVWPVAAIAISYILEQFLPAFTERWVCALAIAAVVAVSVIVIVGAERARARVDEYHSIEQALNINDDASAKQIYTDDFSFYFPSRMLTPRTSGGWAEIGLDRYLQSMPHISANSVMELHNQLVRNGIRAAIMRRPAINERFYGFIAGDTADFKLIERTEGHERYAIIP